MMSKSRNSLAMMLGLLAWAGAANAKPLVDMRTSDVTAFYNIYDAAAGRPSATALQRDYIDDGTDGVRQFIPNRILSGKALAEEIARNRPVYERARECLPALAKAKPKLEAAFRRLAALYPQASFPPITILIGRNNSGGTTGESGVLIALEVFCRSSWLQKDPSARLYHLIAHEYGHVEQPAEFGDEDDNPTLLKQALVEGVAELVAQLISGEISNVHLRRWTRGKNADIDARFARDLESTNLSAWLYNGPGTPDHPGDLGYWVGYRIAKAFYDRAGDKREALRALLQLKDPKAILAQSGWRPGIR